jgi:hypothetical protein
MNLISIRLPILLVLATVGVARADIIGLTGLQISSVDNGPFITNTFDYTTSPSNTFNLGPGAAGSTISVINGATLSETLASLTWQVTQSRTAAPSSSTISQSTAFITADSDLNFVLGVSWNGLNVTNGLAALTIRFTNDSDTLLAPEITANRIANITEGNLQSFYTGTLTGGQRINVSINAVLFAVAESPGAASTLGNFSLTLVAVPEPSALSLVLMSCSVLFVRRRRYNLSSLSR